MIFNSDLIDDLARRRVALFLGAGVSASATTAGGVRLKGWDDFLYSVANKTEANLKQQVRLLLERKDYLLACELLQQYYSDGWSDIVASEYDKPVEPSDLHRALLSLGQSLIITTNFDKLIEKAWGEKVGDDLQPKITIEVDGELFRILKEHNRTHIIKLHGTVDRPSSLVFSRSEYIKRAFGNVNYSTFIDSILLNYTILFVGFSMDDPAITSLMESYAYKYKTARPHYIFHAGSMPDNIVRFNKELRKLSTLQYGDSGEYGKLPIVIRDLALMATSRRRELIAETLQNQQMS